jgi:hypothetical protein
LLDLNYLGANNWEPEGNILKSKAISLGVPGVILVTEKVKNTYEESLALAKIISKNRLLY